MGQYLEVGRELSAKVQGSLLGLCEQPIEEAHWEALAYFHGDQHQLIQDYDAPTGVEVDQSLPVADRLLGRYGEGQIENWPAVAGAALRGRDGAGRGRLSGANDSTADDPDGRGVPGRAVRRVWARLKAPPGAGKGAVEGKGRRPASFCDDYGPAPAPKITRFLPDTIYNRRQAA